MNFLILHIFIYKLSSCPSIVTAPQTRMGRRDAPAALHPNIPCPIRRITLIVEISHNNLKKNLI